uniref:Uncharacterized protein n=1 Tax=Knipowitschia caucasica TaxID=637954 RepID=A0AAV2L139_KNICA
MSLRAKSHSDLPSLGKSLDDPLLSTLSLSSSSMGRPKVQTGLLPGSLPGSLPHPGNTNGSNVRRPVRAVRPVSAVAPTGSFLQMNHLQGELVRKRKEVEDLKRENKHLSNEIHMERIMMRNENELSMRNLRNLNQDMQNQLKELKQKLQLSQQRAALSSRAAEEAGMARADADKKRAAADNRALVSESELSASDAERRELRQQLQQLHKEMSLRAKSHSDLPSLGKSLDDPLLSTLSLSSSSMGRPKVQTGLLPGSLPGSLPHPGNTNGSNVRRPVRAVRPVSAVAPTGSFLQMNHLQGELVRKRKEVEDLKRENKHLSNEIHMERIMMRNENELSMRNLRNLNQDMQNQLKELKQKLQLSQQRAALSSRAAEEAGMARADADKKRAAADNRALVSESELSASDAERRELRQQLQQLHKEHKDLQQLQAQSKKNLFELKLQLERVTDEKEALRQEKISVEEDREGLRVRLRENQEERSRLQESEQNSRRRAVMSQEESQKANQAQREADAERRLVERERQERVAECLQWRQRFQELQLRLREEDERRSLRQNKAVQANIQSFFLCVTESDQRVKILKNPDGTPRNFTEGEPVFISTESGSGAERSPSRSSVRVIAPGSGSSLRGELGSGSLVPGQFDELPQFSGGGLDSAASHRHGHKVDYFWIPTNQE